jgi:periplasmic protein TonB
MNRYLLSFITTFFIYIVIFTTFLFSFQEQKTIKSKNERSEENVKFTIVSLPPPKIENIVKEIKKETKKIKEIKNIKKVEPKKITKPKPKPKAKKIIKKVVKKTETKSIEKKIVKKKIQKKIVEKIVKKEIPKKIKNTNNTNNTNNIVQHKKQKTKNILKNEINENLNKQKELYKRIYLSKIKEIISKNKSYPKSAIRRNIQGDVKISLTISPNGELLSFKIIKGNRIFNKSIKKSLEKSFPMKPKKDMFLSNLDLSLTISYKLY